MKAERRHELKENELQHMLEVARKYLDENGKTIGFAVFVIAAVLLAIALTARSRTAAMEATWQRRTSLKFTDAVIGKESLRELAAMTQESPDENFVFKGLVDRGAQALRLSREAPISPDRELNDMARDAFDELLTRFGDNPLALGIAHCGLATVEENEFVIDQDMDHRARAEEHLTAVIESPLLNGMPFQRLALDRRNALDKIFRVVEFQYPVPEEVVTEEAAVVPADPADPIEIDLSKVDLSKVPTIKATAAPAETTPEKPPPTQVEGGEPPPADNPDDGVDPQTDPADPPQD